jgi:lambda family phage portal protein
MKFWPFARKKKSVARRGYAGAEAGRLLADWVAQSTSADAELRGSLKQLRYRSRQLARDNDYMKNFLREVRNNVVGQGIPFQGQVMKQRGKTLDEATNSQIESAWWRWCRKEFCHVAGQLCFDDIERLLIQAIASDGEVYVRKIRRSFGGSSIPFSLELLEADMINDDENGISPTGNEIRMGVEKDQWGRPVAYYVRTRHPGDYVASYGRGKNNESIRVPAEEIIPLFVHERLSQSRGVPWIASALKRLHHMNGYEEAEVIAARAGASLMGFIESDSGQLQGDDVIGSERVSDFQPGVFKYLAPGEKVNVPDLNRPTGTFDPFTRAMLRGV